ncbi:MAG: hypothetical protein ACK50A_08920 [Sphingobacteriaceae bacterium]|jgi:hypothetical protein
MRYILIILILSVNLVRSQGNDSIIAAPLIGVHIGGNLPMADLAKRFGPNLNTGINIMYKTKKNYLIGIDGNYMFGRNIKENVMKNLTNEDGFIIDNEGYPADIKLSERLLTVNLHVGKILPFLSANPNSGLMINAGAGYMQHKIHFVDVQQKIAAINGDIRNGFDRLSNGISLYQFVGYIYLSANRLLNFYAGFESYQGFTKSVRKLNYDTGLADTKSRFDMAMGLRFGWILPLYSRAPKQYFYN